jgi:hypothetical protein
MMGEADLFELADEGSPSVAAWNLVDRALENGGKDNVSVLLLDVLAVEPWSAVAAGARRRESVALDEQATESRDDAPQLVEGEGVLSAPVTPSTPGPLDRLKGLFTR